MDRKQFIQTSFAVCGLGALGTAVALESCKKKKEDADPQGPTVNFTLDLSAAENVALNTTGGVKATNGVIIVNRGNTFIALAQTCTHQGCSIGYNQNGNNFVCPCHGSTYDLNGNVTSGPAPAPVKKYDITKNGNILTIKG